MSIFYFNRTWLNLLQWKCGVLSTLFFYSLKMTVGIGGEWRDGAGGWGQETFPWPVCNESFLVTQPRQGPGSMGEGVLPSPCLLLLPFLLPNTGLVPTDPFRSCSLCPWGLFRGCTQTLTSKTIWTWSQGEAPNCHHLIIFPCVSWFCFDTISTSTFFFLRFNMWYLDIPKKFKI